MVFKVFRRSGAGGGSVWCQFQGELDSIFVINRLVGFANVGFGANDHVNISASSLACTCTLMMADLDANTRDGDSNLFLRIDRVDTLVSVTIPALTTGTFSAIASESMIVGTEINFVCRLLAGGVGSVFLQSIGASFSV